MVDVFDRHEVRFDPRLAGCSKFVRHSDYAVLEAQLAETQEKLIAANNKLILANASTLEATPPALKVTEEEWREIEQAFQPRIRDGYTDVKVSKPGFWFVKGPGPAAAQEAGKP